MASVAGAAGHLCSRLQPQQIQEERMNSYGCAGRIRHGIRGITPIERAFQALDRYFRPSYGTCRHVSIA
jgi:hypothetical protein